MSPLRSSAGPATCRMPTPSSLRTICASEVLPSPGGPASSTWSSASPRAFAASSAIESCSLTRSWPTKSTSVARAERPLELLLGLVAEHGREELGHAAAPQRSAHLLLDRERRVDVGERALGVDQRPAELDERIARDQLARRTRSTSAHRAELLLQLEHDALRGLEADAGNRLEPLHVVARDRAPQLGGRRAGDDRERDLRPHARHAEQQLEELALLGGREAVELQRVLADDGVDLDRDLAACRAAGPTASRRRGSRRRSRRR